MSSNGNGRRPRIPPTDVAAEAALLGSCLASPQALKEVAPRLRPEAFVGPRHADIAASIVVLWGAGRGVDPVTVNSAVATTGYPLEDPTYLTLLVNDCPSVSNPLRYLAVVDEAYAYRQVIAQAVEITDAAYNRIPLAHLYDLLSPPADLTVVNRYAPHSRSAAELIDMPPPSWLIESVIPAGSLVVTYGPPKSAKTFLALHEALCVATGIAMFGNRVQRRKVIYVVAEGARALGQRVEAWCEWHRIDRRELDGWIRFITVAVPLLDRGAVTDLRYLIEEDDAGLVTLDTVARCMVGADENAGKDMGQVVAAMDELRADGPAVHGVHHTGKDTERGMRGHSSLLGAVDTAIEVIGDRNAFRVTMTAQKDAEPTPAWWGKLVHCASSVVIQETGKPEAVTVATREGYMRAISETLEEAKGEPYTERDLTDAIEGRATDVRAALKQLVVEGHVSKEPRPGKGGGFWYRHRHPYVPPPKVEEPADDDEPF